MSLGQNIELQLREMFTIHHLEVVCDSHKHNVPAGTEIHFTVVISATEFEGVNLIGRHRKINEALKMQFEQGIHALSIHAYSEEQWNNKNKQDQLAPESPDCLG